MDKWGHLEAGPLNTPLREIDFSVHICEIETNK